MRVRLSIDATMALPDVERQDDAYLDNIDGRAEEEEHDNLIPVLTNLQLDGYEDDSSPPTPRFLQDQDRWRHFAFVPTVLRRVGRRVVVWARGPQPPHIHRIDPIFPSIQEFPSRLLDAYLPKRRHKVLLLLVFYSTWILSFVLVLRQSAVVTEVAEYGVPVNLGCGNTFFFAGNGCGINGQDCRPFSGESFAFRCPADCASRHVLNPRAVGKQEIIYRSLVIGGLPKNDSHGPAIYRGDSFICASAIHAGVISDTSGGCGVVSTTGRGKGFGSTRRHKITSIGFNSSFPKTFEFKEGVDCEAKDLRWSLFAISLTYTIVFSLFCSAPGVYFFTLFTAIYVHVGFASDPRPHYDLTSLFSDLLGAFLPAAFCAYVMYRYCVRKTLAGLTAHVEKTVLWLGMCWVGALDNYTFGWLPIQRLTAHDLNQQPGAKLALAIIVLLLVGIIAGQVFAFQREGRFKRYIAFYSLLVAGILLSLALPGLNLRIHHYILALLLIAGTSMQTRLCLLYQGLLIGFFINGIARWGFDSVLQTAAALQGDAQHNSLLPEIMMPIINITAAAASTALPSMKLTFNFDTPPKPMDGISVLVNDVERFRAYKHDKTGIMQPFSWERGVNDGMEEGEDFVEEYFRFAYMQGTMVWDYTKAGVWTAEGEWEQMDEGPSKIRREVRSEAAVYMTSDHF